MKTAFYPRNKVVIPIDFSDQSFAALDVGMSMIKAPGNAVVVHVLPELAASEPGVIWHSVDNESRRRHALQAIRERLSEDAYREVQMEVAVGDPGEEITRIAEEEAADLIVMPSHGRRGLRHLLIGSVAERVVRLAHCPVLVLRGLSGA